jgi:hypothetical protein
MSSNGVQFDEDSFSYNRSTTSPGVNRAPVGNYNQPIPGGSERGMAGWLMRHGIAKSNNLAQGILIAIVIVNVIITYVVIKWLL